MRSVWVAGGGLCVQGANANAGMEVFTSIYHDAIVVSTM